MPADPPPRQPSIAERWHIEEMERRQLLEWERQQAEWKRWWNSLSPEEREEVERLREQEKAEARAREQEERRAAEELAAEHRGRVEAYEEAHGGTERLSDRRDFVKRQLAESPQPTALSTGGSLFVLMLFALIPGLLFNAMLHSAGGGIVLAECLTLAGWALWVQRRRERVQLRIALARQQEEVARQMGCGDIECAQCYPDRYFRSRWQGQRREISREDGCAVVGCGACYGE